jgi:hypothetical protein
MLLPHVTPAMLHADYWLQNNPDADTPLLSAAGIAAFNAAVPAAIDIPPVFSLPDALPAAAVRAVIPARPDNARFNVDGAPIADAVWDAITANMALDALPDPVPVRFGVITRRAAVRTLPSDLTALKAPGDIPLDRLQESTVDMGWPVAVLHTTADGQWAFGLTPGYWGWLDARRIGLADRATVEAFATADPFLMATAAWADIARSDGYHHRFVQTGTRIPLRHQADPGEQPDLHTVRVPLADEAGQLFEAVGYVKVGHADWHIGHQPPTLRTVVEGAFGVLGEPYAWGGMRLGRVGRDCSRLVRDAWALTGIALPRNSGQQGRTGVRAATFTPKDSNADRIARLAQVPAGALLFLPGHVMLYLGMVNGIPYAIHDLWGYAHPEGLVTPVERVAVTALPPEPSAARHTLLERLTHVQIVAPFAP